MSLTSRKSGGSLFFTLSAYNRYRSSASQRSDSSISDAESIQYRRSGTLFFTLSAYNRFRRLTSRRSDSSISDAESIRSSQAEEQGSTGDCLPTQHTEGEILSSPNLKAFTFKELKSATRNFCPDSFMENGGFYYVFKGWIDEQTFTASKPGVGMAVAVKKLDPKGYLGCMEYQTEIHYLGQLHHPNLVKLIGFCSVSNILVYEFMPGGSLNDHIFGKGPLSLSWATRIKVAIGVAKGLTFLHNAKSQVIHRDVTPSNILLDSDFNAKLSGFGLAVAGEEFDGTLAGTIGYLAPEYIETGHLSAKADVYSFGVVLLQLLSGCRPYPVTESGFDGDYIVKFARYYLADEQELFRIMDSQLEGQYPMKVAHAMAKLVLTCTDNDPELRPSMSEVLAVLAKLSD